MTPVSLARFASRCAAVLLVAGCVAHGPERGAALSAKPPAAAVRRDAPEIAALRRALKAALAQRDAAREELAAQRARRLVRAGKPRGAAGSAPPSARVRPAVAPAPARSPGQQVFTSLTTAATPR